MFKMILRHVRLVCLVLCLALTLGLAAHGKVTAQTDTGWTRTDQTLPFVDVQLNVCNNDLVTLTGQATFTSRTKVQPDGTLSLKESLSVALTGVGTPSNADYTYSDSSVQRADGIGSLPFSTMLNRVGKLIGDGVPDMYLHYKVRVTIDADGNITHEVFDLQINCNP